MIIQLEQKSNFRDRKWSYEIVDNKRLQNLTVWDRTYSVELVLILTCLDKVLIMRNLLPLKDIKIRIQK